MRGDAPPLRVLLEQLFAPGSVNILHLADCQYRARFEQMAPDGVLPFLVQAQEPDLAGYLRRVLEFSRQVVALEQAPEGERESVTFIMGDRDDSFYANADRYYRLDNNARTEYVVTSVRSLEEVRDWLVEHRPRNGLPWGVVNIVVHTYEWGGMATPVERGGSGRTDFLSLSLALQAGRFRPLPDSLADVRTDIRIQGCALGRDRNLLVLLSRAFGGRDHERPAVRSSKYFVFYETTWRNGRVVGASQYLAEYWHVPYSLYSRPDNEELAQRFEERYPDAGVDWRAALRRTRPRRRGEPYAHDYNVPVTWLVLCDDSVPGPDTALPVLDRVRAQKELTAQLAELGLAAEELRWKLVDTVLVDDSRDGPHRRRADSAGAKRAALMIAGLGSVLSVQRELAEPDPERLGEVRRVAAAPTDTFYFGAVEPARVPANPPGYNVLFEP